MFEGSIALTQVGIFWKEISVRDEDQIYSSISSFSRTDEVIRIQKVWHLPYYPDAPGAYSDDDADGNVNIERQEVVEIENPSNNSPSEWFVGDVVPF